MFFAYVVDFSFWKKSVFYIFFFFYEYGTTFKIVLALPMKIKFTSCQFFTQFVLENCLFVKYQFKMCSLTFAKNKNIFAVKLNLLDIDIRSIRSVLERYQKSHVSKFDNFMLNKVFIWILILFYASHLM